MRELLAQTLERASDTDRRLADLHQGKRAERIGREVAEQDRASLAQFAGEADERRDLFGPIEDTREDRDEEARREVVLGRDAERRAHVGKAIALGSLERFVRVGAR